MVSRTVALVALVFAAGAVLGRSSRPPGGPADLSGMVRLKPLREYDAMGRLDDDSRHFAPYRVFVDERVVNFTTAPPDGAKWRLDLAGGRVVLFMVAAPPPAEWIPWPQP